MCMLFEFENAVYAFTNESIRYKVKKYFTIRANRN